MTTLLINSTHSSAYIFICYGCAGKILVTVVESLFYVVTTTSHHILITLSLY